MKEENREHYVYALKNSITGDIIYIGKGKGDRMLQHKKVSIQNKHCNKKLERKIHSVLRNGGDILCEKLYDGLTNDESLSIEKQIIADIGLKNICNLTAGGIGGDCLTNNPNYTDICKRMGDSRRGRKRSQEEIDAVLKGKVQYYSSEEFHNQKKIQSEYQKQLGENNELYKYIKNETAEQREKRMQACQAGPRWNKGLTKDTSDILKAVADKRRGCIPGNGERCYVEDINSGEVRIFETVSMFKAFLKDTYKSLNSGKLQMHLNGHVDSYRDFKVVKREKYGKVVYKNEGK